MINVRHPLPPHDPEIRRFFPIVNPTTRATYKRARVRAWYAQELEEVYTLLRFAFDEGRGLYTDHFNELIAWLLDHSPPIGPDCRDWSWLFEEKNTALVMKYFIGSKQQFTGGELLAFHREKPVLPWSGKAAGPSIPFVGLQKGDMLSACAAYPQPKELLQSLSVPEYEAFMWRYGEAMRPEGELKQDMGQRELDAHPQKEEILGIVASAFDTMYVDKFGCSQEEKSAQVEEEQEENSSPPDTLPE